MESLFLRSLNSISYRICYLYALMLTFFNHLGSICLEVSKICNRETLKPEVFLTIKTLLYYYITN